LKLLEIDPRNPDPAKLEAAIQVLRQGGVIAYPTETVYGLGADLFSKQAVQKVFDLKQRDASMPLSVMVPTTEMAEDLCSTISDGGRALMSQFWPGPLTLIFRASSKAPQYIVSVQGNIGLRCPDHPVSQELLNRHGGPITCTSANISGHESARNAEEVADAFGADLDLIIDGGMSRIKIASTVVDVSSGKIQILRQGAISSEEIDKALGRRKPQMYKCH